MTKKKFLAGASAAAVNVDVPVFRHGFVEQVHWGKAIPCGAEGCGNLIAAGSKVFMDTEDVRGDNPGMYCYVCGPVKRFERKRQKKREGTG